MNSGITPDATTEETPPTRHGRDRGQIVVLFALCMLGMIAFAGLLIDGGLAWSARRQAQAAADTAALSAAYSVISGAADGGASAAVNTAGMNGFTGDLLDCNGHVIKNGGVVITAVDATHVQVTVTRAMYTTLSQAIGQKCFLVSATATAYMDTAKTPTCNFCSLNSTSLNHTLMLKNGSSLRVDGDIYVNSSNFTNKLAAYFVYGDGFDIFGAGGTISANHIYVNGGWETHNANIASASSATCSAGNHPVPPSSPTSTNICINQGALVDPLQNMPEPTKDLPPMIGRGGCPIAGVTVPTNTINTVNPAPLSISSSTTLCPGTYYGGISISGGTTTMLPGLYYMATGGFSLTGSANLDARGVDPSTGQVRGVTLFNGTNDPFVQPFDYPTNYPAVNGALPTPKAVMTSSLASPQGIGATVTFTLTLTVTAGQPLPTGTMDFYNGTQHVPTNYICTGVPITNVNATTVRAQCVKTFLNSGIYTIVGVYWPSGWGSGANVYNATFDTFNMTIGTVSTSAGSVTLQTTGWVWWMPPTDGVYAGMTIFQTKNAASTVTVAMAGTPGGIGACPGSGWWNVGRTTPCGPLGGLTGTIYAPNKDATVSITGTTNGLADMQIIAGKMYLDTGIGRQIEFAYTAQYFAKSSVRLAK
jgi:Flp pilus assembly protein TadG